MLGNYACLCLFCFLFFVLLFCQWEGDALTGKDYEGQNYNTWNFFKDKTSHDACF